MPSGDFRYATQMRLTVILLSLLLTACGFQLRGSAVLPEGMDRLFLVAPNAVRDQMSIFLQGSETQLVSDRSTADVILTVSDANYTRRVLTVDPDTGKEREFELAYSLNMSARRSDGTSLVDSQRVTLLRDYVFDRTTLIGSGREESSLREEMLRDAVQQVLYRLRIATDRG